jgi:hypothetical protein
MAYAQPSQPEGPSRRRKGARGPEPGNEEGEADLGIDAQIDAEIEAGNAESDADLDARIDAAWAQTVTEIEAAFSKGGRGANDGNK